MTVARGDCTAILVSAIQRPVVLGEFSLRQWDHLLQVARQANLLGRLAEGIAACSPLVPLPPQVCPHLDGARALTRHQREAIAWEVRHIGEALAPLGIPLVLLKGSAYALAGLPAARGRLFGDVDLLVPRDALNQVEAALMLHGWSADYHDDYDARYYRQWMHELPPMVHRKRGTVIDVHHNILPMTAKTVPDASKLLAAAVPVAGTPFHVLSPQDMVLHSATHLFHEGELRNGLRDLFDLDALVRDFVSRGEACLAGLPERAQGLGLLRPLHHALHFLQVLLGTPMPGDLPRRVGELSGLSRMSQRAIDGMYLRGLQPMHPSCAMPGTSVARLLIYLRGHLLRMPPGKLAFHLGRKAVMHLYKNTSRDA